MVGLLFLSSPVSSPCVGVWGLVGLLFEICIVDASIFTACLFFRVCGECVIIFSLWPVSLRVAVSESLPACPLIGGGSGVLWFVFARCEQRVLF